MKAFVDLSLVHSMVMNHNAPKVARHSIADALMELPRIELSTDPDPVSRKAVLEAYDGWIRGSLIGRGPFEDALRDLPSAHVPVPADVVTAEDVVEGVEWHDGKHGHTVQEDLGPGREVLIGCPGYLRWFSRESIADILNGVMRRDPSAITWPEGHRLAPKPEPEPTLMERDAVEEVLQLARQLATAVDEPGSLDSIVERHGSATAYVEKIAAFLREKENP